MLLWDSGEKFPLLVPQGVAGPMTGFAGKADVLSAGVFALHG